MVYWIQTIIKPLTFGEFSCAICDEGEKISHHAPLVYIFRPSEVRVLPYGIADGK